MSLVRHRTGLNNALISIKQRSDPRKGVNFRVTVKRAPYLSTLGLHDPADRKYLNYADQFHTDVSIPEEDRILYKSGGLDKLNPNIETNFGRSGRIDAPRPARDKYSWEGTMEKYEKYLEPQKDAEFIRKLPTTMLTFNTQGFSNSSVGLLQGDKSTDTELVYLNATGKFTVKYTGENLHFSSLVPEKVIVEEICQTS